MRFFCFWISCKFGSGIGLSNQMVYLAQTISRLAATVLLSIIRSYGVRRSKSAH